MAISSYGLIVLKPENIEEQNKIKSIIKICYKGKVEPVPKKLRNDFSKEVSTHFYDDDLVWTIKFNYFEGYDKFVKGNALRRFNLHGIFPICDMKPPEAIRNMKKYKEGRSLASMYLKEAKKNKNVVNDNNNISSHVMMLSCLNSCGLDRKNFEGFRKKYSSEISKDYALRGAYDFLEKKFFG